LFSLGNLGYSSVQCFIAPIAVYKVSLTCSYGVVGQIYDFGINNFLEDRNPIDQCSTNDAN